MIDQIDTLVPDVSVHSVNPRDPVIVSAHPETWRCIGVGNSAAVFQPKDRPDLAVKVYARDRAEIAAREASIYRQLGDSAYFPHYYGHGDRYLVIEYRQGINLYDCLVQGHFIPEQVIRDVDAAIAYARERGLNPSDIHVKNVLVHEGRGYLVDVSDYTNPDVCKRWDTLKKAYYEYYLDLYKPGLAVPNWILETIRKWYKATEGEGNIAAFADRIKRMFF
ncbi:MAG TPA: serine/threonine protein kinase [Bacilli bacterium]|nr:serine/threonine protein kinase [Bacilli bacterium]